MTVEQVQASKWKAVCPKCGAVAASHESNMRCPNCNSTVHLYTPMLMNRGDVWESEEAEYGWHMIMCDNKCGWRIQKLDCPSCGAAIQGRFLEREGCFVATACFGNDAHPLVESLRSYRDHCLVRSAYGVKFVDWYYKRGPAYAQFIEHKPILKWCIRQVLRVVLIFLPH